MNYLITFFIGTLFALGLGVSQMTNPQKILGFLNVFGNWDPTLAVVMAAAVSVYVFFYHFYSRSSVFDWKHMPTKKTLDAPLILGAALFGVGWGLIGFCPGPSIAALASGKSQVLIFVASMSLGIWTLQGIRGKVIPPQ